MKSPTKWPCSIQITRVFEGLGNEELTAYLIVGVMNKNQVETIANRMPVHSNKLLGHPITKQQVSGLRSWRPWYYLSTKNWCCGLSWTDRASNHTALR